MFTVQVNKIWHLLLDLLQTYYEDDFRVQLIMINCLNSWIASCQGLNKEFRIDKIEWFASVLGN